MRWLAHTIERPDDKPAHIKAMLTTVSPSIATMDSRPALGAGTGSICSNTATGRRRGGWWGIWVDAGEESGHRLWSRFGDERTLRGG
jgi:hypothetical protein